MIYNEIKQHGSLAFPIELYHTDKNHPRFEMASHWHSQIEIIKVLKGTLNVRLYNNEYIATAGDVIFVNPETVHGASPTQDCVYECIVCHLDFLYNADNICKFFIESLLNREFKINEYNPAADTLFHQAINILFDVMSNKSSGYKLKVVGALYWLFGVIIDSHLYSLIDIHSITTDKNIPKLKRVLAFIRENFDKQISLADMAETAGMSPKYFCYFFKELTTKTPVEYLNSYRIERAIKVLISTDKSVSEIAFSSGFNDLSYFIKTFKAIKGTTPAQYRKNNA